MHPLAAEEWALFQSIAKAKRLQRGDFFLEMDKIFALLYLNNLKAVKTIK